ncbi:MAG: M16 family metallopeptidase [Mariprofundaceae bacterium]
MKKLFVCIALLLCMPVAATAVPPIQQAILDNGLKIMLMEAHNVPMVSMRLVMPAGSRSDPDGKGGTASLLAGMLTDHTARHDDDAWARLLDREAIRLGADVDRDALGISMTVLREALPAGMAAFSETVLHPGWNARRFAILKEDAIAAAKKAQEEPRVRAAEAIASMLFEGHPYGHRSAGSVNSLPRITLADLKRLYERQCRPQGAVLAVSGDIHMQEIQAMAARLFADWKGKPAAGLLDIAPPQAVHGTSRDIHMNTKQTHVALVRLGPARNSTDFFPTFVLNHILGGGSFSSRVMEEVREKRGLAYAAYSYFVPLATLGPFVINLQTRADQAGQAESVVRQLLSEMYAGKTTGAQLKAAKDNLSGSFAQRLDSNRERVGLIAMIGFYGLPQDYLQVWTQRVESVTLSDIRKVAEKYLDPTKWNLLRVGPITGENKPA